MPAQDARAIHDGSGALPIEDSVLANQRLLQLAAIVIIALGLIRLFPAIDSVAIHNDFSHYYVGGSLYMAGESAYRTKLEPLMAESNLTYDPTIPYAAHPPLLLMLFGTLSVLPIQLAYWTWLLIQVVVAIACLELIRRIVRLSWDDFRWLMLVGIFVNSISFQMLIYYSQVQLVVACLLYGAFLAGSKQRHNLACAVITLASALKIYPVFAAPWIFFRGLSSWRDALGRLTAMAATSVLCLATPGLGTWFDFVINGVPTLATNATKWCNFSFQNLWSMLLRIHPEATENWAWIGPTVAVLALATAYLFSVCSRQRPLISYCLVLIATICCGVITWSHYLTVLWLPLAALLLVDSNSNGYNHRNLLTAICAIAVLMPKLDCYLLDTQFTYWRIGLHFYPLFAAIALGCILYTRTNRPLSAGV